ncbi:DUF190 domain-containing protein [Streptomyces iconiensis]|uniref:DUF190 domain-containing protein n=1 Tax=Streptomyces iconiensis TaxID=1384038 RepID=A0ABT6ZPE7_9ACTN|nr:DUF190 domain-containing protein [Streptomyces iconiensis]MDJ1130541.1 DUF190 domain-containing protein [Streptomyces iconiensis]
MRVSGVGVRATVFLSESDTWHGKSLCHHVVGEAQRLGLAGATVSRAVEGYGASTVLHTDRLLSASDDLPLVVTVIDSEHRIRHLLRELQRPLDGRMVVLDTVTVLRGPAG